MGNITLWDELRAVPEGAKKTIKGGRLNGMTDISPMWRWRRLTELFGPCGAGWKFTIEKMWTETGTDSETAAFAKVNLYIRHDGAWSEAIPGIGGSKFVTKEKNGLHISDEAYKMAVTDALGTAAKMIGLGADVYAGASAYDSKYTGNNTTPSSSMISLEQAEAIANRVHALYGTKSAPFFSWLKTSFQVETVSEISASDFPAVMNGLAAVERQQKERATQ